MSNGIVDSALADIRVWFIIIVVALAMTAFFANMKSIATGEAVTLMDNIENNFWIALGVLIVGIGVIGALAFLGLFSDLFGGGAV